MEGTVKNSDKPRGEGATAAAGGDGLGSTETRSGGGGGGGGGGSGIDKVEVTTMKYSVLPIQQPSSDPTLTCSGLDTGIQIEDFIINEAEEAQDAAAAAAAAAAAPAEKTSQPAAAAAEAEAVVVVSAAQEQQRTKAPAEEEPVEADVPMGKNSIEIEVTTTVGENEAVVGPVTTDQQSGAKSCVVNMASLEEESKRGRKKAETPKGGKPPNGALRGRKPAAEPKSTPGKRGRKPGSKNADKSKLETASEKEAAPPAPPVTIDLTTQPFNDAQQHQLRAQILVYGAIIQSALPDEPLMGASFMDTSKVRGGDAMESHYAAAKAAWDKTYKATVERINKAGGLQRATMVNPVGSPLPTFVNPGPASLPPKSGATTTKGKATTKNAGLTGGSASEFPSVSPLALSAMNMASATVSSWNSAARGQWGMQNRFPFQQQAAPWGSNAQWGAFSQGSPGGFPFQTVVAASGSEPKSKRRRTGEDSSTPSVVPVIEVEDSPTSVPEKTPAATPPEEYVRQVEVAKQTAEDAASASATMVQQSQRLWEEIKQKMKNNAMTQKEAQVASCMAAISAASSVAKAASAAAHVAYAAALQAKAMAMEASDEDLSVITGTNGTSNGANLITSAKKAAKDQAKAGLAVTQRAENVAAIIRAAELASEAACHAGELMSIDPSPIQDKGGKSKGRRTGTPRAKTSTEKKAGGRTEEEKSPEPAVVATTMDAVPVTAVATMDTPVPAATKDGQAKDDAENAKDGEADPSEGMVENRQHQKPADIEEGTHIEIVPDEEGLQGVWFAAVVLQLKGDKALVKYDDLLADDGETPLEEWVDLTGHLDNVPRVRLAHPVTTDASVKKRRRAAMGNQTWMQGDHVDVWMRDGWWEGIVQSVVEEDHTVTVFFPADGDTEHTKSWNLRASLLWHDGAWIPWRDMHDQKASSPISTDESQEKSENEAEAPRPRGRGRPPKRRKFADVMGKEDEKMKSLQTMKTPSPPPAAAATEPKKPSPKSTAKRTPLSARKSAEKKKSTSSDVTTDDGGSAGGEVRKSTRLQQHKTNVKK